MNAAPKPRARLILILLVIIFAAPPLVSWLLFRFTDIGRDAGAHGELIQPPRPLPDVTLIDGTGGRAQLHGHWTLLYIASGACPDACTEALYRMRQVRLATGRNAARLQRALILTASGAPLAQLAAEWPGQWFVEPGAGFSLEPFRLGAGDDPRIAGRLYLVDARGFLMMSYAPDAEPDGVISDLKRLLRYSRGGG